MKIPQVIFIPAILIAASIAANAQGPATKPAASAFDESLARKLGADDYGMRKYVLCVLKTGPKDAEIKEKPDRDKIFAGHMANIGRLASEGKLAVAGPFGANDKGYRGIFVFAVETVEEAQKLVETDPVIKSGLMVADLTPWYATAAMMVVNDTHNKIAKKSF
nr:hypothetical protein [uncultured bacterium]